MADWEDEEFEPSPRGFKKDQQIGMWDDEDADDDDVKDSWEDDEEPQKTPKQEPAVAKPASKSTEKNEIQPEIETKHVAYEVLSDPVAEKFRQQRLVEEADFKSTAELFGKKEDEKSLDNFILKSESDFLEYAELLYCKIRPYEKSFHYVSLLKSVMRLSMTTLKAADAKDVASSVTAIANEKFKVEKEANAGKKKQGLKKKQLLVDKPDDDIDGLDFM